MNRRLFLKAAAGAGGLAAVSSLSRPLVSDSAIQGQTARVAFVKTADRASGVGRPDAPPGSTHNDTLVALITQLRKMGAGPLSLGDRSGMGQTREVMEAKEVFKLARDMGVKAVVLDELPAEDWELIKATNSHWQRGFALPRPVLSAGGIVQTCCLKTHRFGGHFTLSLKNSVGLAAKRVPGDPYNYMSELHGSPHQRRMIAEINAAYRPALVVLDGVDAFVNGGPESGQKESPQVILAGTDRVAVDAVGVALLRYFGTTPEVSRGSVFEQEQIARAVQLRIGVSGADQIELVTGDPDSADYAKKIRAVLG
jgi:uncharacterized protein (DUF362 family)